MARATSGLTGADLENIANEAAIRAARAHRDRITRTDFDHAMERVVAGLQTRRVISDKEKRVIAYHEAGHALMSHLLGGEMAVHKVTIVPRGGALGYTMSLPEEDRFLRTKEELVDQLMILLAGRAAEEEVFGRISNGAANDLERVTAVARAMVFESGMGEGAVSRTMRADNYALSEETKTLRDAEQARICDTAYADARRLVAKHRAALDSLAARLLEVETLDRREVEELLANVVQETMNAQAVGRPRVMAAPAPRRTHRSQESGKRPEEAWPFEAWPFSLDCSAAISAFLASMAARASLMRWAAAPRSDDITACRPPTACRRRCRTRTGRRPPHPAGA